MPEACRESGDGWLTGITRATYRTPFRKYTLLARHLGDTRARCIISGLAWGNMLPATQDRIMNAIVSSLAPGGQFVAFAYVHARYYPTTLRFRKLMFREFAKVETSPIIWRNVPPAYVYRCWRA